MKGLQYLALGLVVGLQAMAVQAANLTLVIDDLGYQLEAGRRALALPGPIAYAILPQTPYGTRLARTAHQLNKTVMLHLPMAGHTQAIEKGTLTSEMSAHDIEQQLLSDLEQVPHAQGVNNHQGSRLTSDITSMQRLMPLLKQQGLFFLDSRTSAQSVAAQTARRDGLPTLERRIFLDHVQTPEAIADAWDQAIDIAQRRGHVVAIGHPHPETLAFLAKALPQLREHGITLLSPTQWLTQTQPQQWQAMQQQRQHLFAQGLAIDSQGLDSQGRDSQDPRPHALQRPDHSPKSAISTAKYLTTTHSTPVGQATRAIEQASESIHTAASGLFKRIADPWFERKQPAINEQERRPAIQRLQ